jgi:hypothetical protein
MPCIRIIPSVKKLEHCIKYDFVLSYPDERPNVNVYYEVFGIAEKPNNFDGILFALIFHAMKEGLDLKLEGPASVETLINLKEFQLAWSSWRPLRYKRIQVESSCIVERSVNESDHVISAFSGGVDATFTLFNHAPTTKGLHRKLAACMLVHGFDITLDNHLDFASVLNKAQQLHARHGLKTFWVKTNIKALGLQNWEDSFSAQLVSCLQLFSHDFSVGLVGSSEPYNALVIPWGSNPITDYLLSGSAMRIVHDGAGFSRTQKVEALSQIPSAIDSLRVCWSGEKQDRNCGRCEKCVRTKLNLLACEIQQPLCFDEPLNLKDIDGIKLGNAAALAELQSILTYADEKNIKGRWVDHLRRRVKRGIQRSWKERLKVMLARLGMLEAALATKRRLLRPH